MVKESDRASLLNRNKVSRRDVLRVGGAAALGLAFAKPIINTTAPPPVYAPISPVTPPELSTLCLERPFAITFAYTGAVCAVPLANPQLDNKLKPKAFCTDVAPVGPGPVEIV